MNAPVVTQLGTVNAMLASVPASVVSLIEKTVGGTGAQLCVAECIEQELATAEQGILVQLRAARDAAAARASAIRAELNAAAVDRVLGLLKAGDLTLEALAAQIGAGVPAALVVAPAPVTQGVAPAPAAVEAVPAAAAAATPAAPSSVAASNLPPEIRANLALQAGYLNDVKYRDEVSGLGWSGRGPTPKWLKKLCVDGKTKDDFLVVKPAAVAQAQADQQKANEEAAVPASAGAEVVMMFDATDIESGLDEPVEVDGAVPGDDGIDDVLSGIEAMGTLTCFGARIGSAANQSMTA
ncbi:hypothetical protein ABIC83_002408 [Roseateles asaccharophilus]|uniref:H-NS family nucleoid-associated regulatory protein n=1 Tax=Roseateles asaccharophilus TaxID=582607 RepID=UPI003832ACF9